MKLLNTITSVAILSLTSVASAHCGCGKEKKADAPVCEKTCPKDATACEAGECDATKFAVTGMTCNGCANKVTKALTAIEGVTVKKVCHKSGTVAVEIDEAKTTNAKVQEAISATGFKVVGEKVSLPVTGMTCSACSDKLTKALNALDGCTVSSICAKSGHAELVIDSSKVTKEKVVETVTATGFKVPTKEVKKEAKTSVKKG